MSTWVQDFSKMQRDPPSRKEKLKSELKLLEWHKLANEAAIKAALLQTKSLKEGLPQKAPVYAPDDARWMRKVVEDEFVKPLQVSKDYVLDYDKKERENSERLANQVQRHISTLQKLRSKLEDREEVRSRSEEYRTWKRGFTPKKNMALYGTTTGTSGGALSADRGAQQEGLAGTMSPPGSNDRGRGGYPLAPSAPSSAAAAHGKPPKGREELSNVLDSLNKLTELEQRISSLENENAYNELIEAERQPLRTTIAFKKKKANAPRPAPPTVGDFTVKPKKTQWQVKLPSVAASGGQAAGSKSVAGILAARARRKVTNVAGKGAVQPRGNGFDAFLTDLGDDGSTTDNDYGAYHGESFEREEENGDQRDARLRERKRMQELAPAGQKNLRDRVRLKKARQKEQATGALRHEEAMREINRRLAEQQARRAQMAAYAKAALGPVRSAKGASAGVKTKNKYMADFERSKAAFAKQRDGVVKRPQVSIGTVARLASLSAPPAIGGGRGRAQAVERNRLPPIPPSQQHMMRQGGGSSITRRTDKAGMPVRRPGPGGDYDVAAAGVVASAQGNRPVAVRGIAGLRAIRQVRMSAARQ